MAAFTMKELLEAGIHFGHQTRRWNPKMKRYIYGQRNGIYIIDLAQTMRQLHAAYVTVRDVAAQGGNVLFVGTKNQAQEPISREAQRCGMFYVNSRWLGGTLTNWETIRKSIRKLKQLEEMETSGAFEQYTKKERIGFVKTKEKLSKNLDGIKDMPGQPQVVFVIDVRREGIAVREAERLGITCVGIVDTNSDPGTVSLPVPGNDDAIRAVNLFAKIMADAVIEGRSIHEKARADQQAEQRAKVQAASSGEGAPAEEAKPAPDSLAAAEAVASGAATADSSGGAGADSAEPATADVKE
jgi:small subunit ribosomal protein S2